MWFTKLFSVATNPQPTPEVMEKLTSTIEDTSKGNKTGDILNQVQSIIAGLVHPWDRFLATVILISLIAWLLLRQTSTIPANICFPDFQASAGNVDAPFKKRKDAMTKQQVTEARVQSWVDEHLHQKLSSDSSIDARLKAHEHGQKHDTDLSGRVGDIKENISMLEVKLKQVDQAHQESTGKAEKSLQDLISKLETYQDSIQDIRNIGAWQRQVEQSFQNLKTDALNKVTSAKHQQLEEKIDRLLAGPAFQVNEAQYQNWGRALEALERQMAVDRGTFIKFIKLVETLSQKIDGTGIRAHLAKQAEEEQSSSLAPEEDHRGVAGEAVDATKPVGHTDNVNVLEDRPTASGDRSAKSGNSPLTTPNKPSRFAHLFSTSQTQPSSASQTELTDQPGFDTSSIQTIRGKRSETNDSDAAKASEPVKDWKADERAKDTTISDGSAHPDKYKKISHQVKPLANRDWIEDFDKVNEQLAQHERETTPSQHVTGASQNVAEPESVTSGPAALPHKSFHPATQDQQRGRTLTRAGPTASPRQDVSNSSPATKDPLARAPTGPKSDWPQQRMPSLSTSQQQMGNPTDQNEGSQTRGTPVTKYRPDAPTFQPNQEPRPEKPGKPEWETGLDVSKYAGFW
ncbi:MAG: hypothetical protein Q9159_005633 [Coniocarpon cinnabarinum]